ncbi:hypothetical protein Y032_0879g2829 [Ancylostoma ceylanicum]|uniref:Uncharacterized protein n=1 Tax=Ancylostoma ceylanicum TaxID=53326 RepID=A0A016WAF2_9BILA|nr:hypothetical protein Y032_0879g2829 [Ancylostoma ceylanicum]
MNEVHILTCQVYPVSEMSFRCSFALKNMRRVAADSSTARMLTTLITDEESFTVEPIVNSQNDRALAEVIEQAIFHGKIVGMCAVAFERIGRQSMEHGVEKEEQRELKL